MVLERLNTARGLPPHRGRVDVGAVDEDVQVLGLTPAWAGLTFRSSA